MNWENTIKKEKISDQRYFKILEFFKFDMGRLSTQVMRLEDEIKQEADKDTLLKEIDYIKKSVSRNMENGLAFIKEARQGYDKS
jgi:hypothetical protein|tara:strand:- start:893 stop:1144 length:252 start_codon:yes stop_codon:yes gene_type:complete